MTRPRLQQDCSQLRLGVGNAKIAKLSDCVSRNTLMLRQGTFTQNHIIGLHPGLKATQSTKLHTTLSASGSVGDFFCSCYSKNRFVMHQVVDCTDCTLAVAGRALQKKIWHEWPQCCDKYYLQDLASGVSRKGNLEEVQGQTKVSHQRSLSARLRNPCVPMTRSLYTNSTH